MAVSEPADVVTAYLDHLAVERGTARNTLDSYARDLRRYVDHLDGEFVPHHPRILQIGVPALEDVIVGSANADPAGAHQHLVGVAVDGRIELGGELPMNTSGGLLSEAHIGGWNSILEMVRQLRGTAGERQIRSAKHLQWATVWGDSVVLHA
jgi:hypothetical protein